MATQPLLDDQTRPSVGLSGADALRYGSDAGLPKGPADRPAPQNRILNLSILAIAVGASLGMAFGAVSADMAFFLAVTAMAFGTAYQMTKREGRSLLDAVRDMFVEGAGYPRRTAYLAYVISMGLSMLVLIGALV